MIFLFLSLTIPPETKTHKIEFALNESIKRVTVHPGDEIEIKFIGSVTDLDNWKWKPYHDYYQHMHMIWYRPMSYLEVKDHRHSEFILAYKIHNISTYKAYQVIDFNEVSYHHKPNRGYHQLEIEIIK